MAYTFKVMKHEKIIAEATTFAEAQAEAERTGAHVLIPVPKRNPAKRSKRNPSVYQLQPESKQAICKKVASLQVGDFVTLLQKGAAYSPDKVRAEYQVVMRHGDDVAVCVVVWVVVFVFKAQ